MRVTFVVVRCSCCQKDSPPVEQWTTCEGLPGFQLGISFDGRSFYDVCDECTALPFRELRASIERNAATWQERQKETSST